MAPLLNLHSVYEYKFHKESTKRSVLCYVLAVFITVNDAKIHSNNHFPLLDSLLSFSVTTEFVSFCCLCFSRYKSPYMVPGKEALFREELCGYLPISVFFV